MKVNRGQSQPRIVSARSKCLLYFVGKLGKLDTWAAKEEVTEVADLVTDLQRRKPSFAMPGFALHLAVSGEVQRSAPYLRCGIRFELRPRFWNESGECSPYHRWPCAKMGSRLARELSFLRSSSAPQRPPPAEAWQPAVPGYRQWSSVLSPAGATNAERQNHTILRAEGLWFA